MAQLYSQQTLHYLDILLKHGNFTKAAKDLYVSQPHLTQTIKRIETELGAKIINRDVIPLQLTAAGKVYHQYLMTAENRKEKFRQQLFQYTNPDKKVIHIGILSSLGSFLLPLFLPEFMRTFPDVKIELHEALPEINEAKILNGQIDFFIGQNPETISPNLKKIHFGNHGYFALIPKCSTLYQPSHYRIPDQDIPLKTLLKEPLILTKRGSAIRRQVDYLLQKYKIQPNIVLETNNIYTAINLSRENAGVTLFAESIKVVDQHQAFNIYKLPLSLLSLDYFISYDTKKILDPIDQEFLTYFEKASAKLG
ncbi:LysR family transcriptional regulator [Lactococcus paracarnosus]|uniref:LysR family transcriptional regulator n=1 Tax=Pseudolactococcus paracarnosus TaxID=2749962 RepID=A0A7L4WDR1_9LACT|nr:LysR family transcriptional regulator [Lactococcus paracarnosus]SPC35050.1 Transcription regulator [Lactococcus piscium]MCJ1978123.1 LysR family transcriptional regulator [Lactococcus paracarnosus]MCJ1984302.1 LysR family transcriptional regulator [Lactococcus paracarnosus]MCJ1994893.1 LysR family transcriptional regulator [Lactococcus paracarnosus]MCJ1998594.1 LysR family transcriptional regulator [Lactococcus paracarnosus]